MNLNLKKIFQLECLIIVVIIISFIVFSFLPAIQQISQLSQKVKLARRAIDSLSAEEKERMRKNALEELVRVQQDAEVIKSLSDVIHKKVSRATNASLVNLEMEDLVSSSSIDLGSIKHLTASQKKDVEVLPIQMAFTCEYPHLFSFLTDIENSDTFFALKYLSIQKEENAYPLLNVRLTLHAFYTAEKEAKDDEKAENLVVQGENNE